MSERHNCGSQGWSHCCICDGRIHQPGCTSRMRPDRDCCEARHKRLHDAGQTRGLGDDSMIMWSPEHPQGCHESDIKTGA